MSEAVTVKDVCDHQIRHGKKLFTPEDIRRMLEKASIPLRAMILLGINGGMGNKDCGRLPLRIVQFDKGVYAHGKISLGTRSDATREEFDKVLVKRNLKRKGVGFYALRHTFRTWAGEVQDPHAVYRIMGDVVPGMDAYYVEEIELPRLQAVVDHVRQKLFGTRPTAP
ncbi:MAG: hypothetical protein NTV86_13705 [Planctomycetota bacterium]|nr:hypothetical protein [Planctomycetota bacterium]